MRRGVRIGLQVLCAGFLLVIALVVVLISTVPAPYGGWYYVGAEIRSHFPPPWKNPLVELAERGRTEELIAVAAQRPELINYVDQHNDPPLWVAIRAGNLRTVKALLDLGADPHKEAFGIFQSAFFRAIRSCKSEVALFLAEHKERTLTPQEMEALRNKDSGLLGTLAGCSYLDQDHRASVAVAALLLQFGAPLNQPSVGRSTPLGIAVDVGKNEELVAFFLASGADPNLVPPLTASPLAHAVSSGRSGMVRLLLAHGADPNWAYPPTKQRVIDRAKDAEIRDLLLKHGAKP